MNQIYDLSRSILVLSSHQRLGLPAVLFLSAFPHQNPVYVPPPHFSHAPHIWFPSSWCIVNIPTSRRHIFIFQYILC